MNTWTHAITLFIESHPHWAGLLVFLVAAAEAVVLIGYMIPGTAILIAVGSIVGLGHLPLLPILIWAAAGAILGDGFSYWLGHTYKEGLRSRWPFARYPKLLEQGEIFFHRHGAKSVVFGRFVPVLKPIIPTVAGILGMPPGRFYLANILSALVWSPVHILPGVLLGASLGLLHGVSGRLVVVAVTMIGLLFLALWLMRLAILNLAPMLNRLHRHLFEWACTKPESFSHRLIAPFDPDHPGTPGLLIALAALMAASLGFASILEDILNGEQLVQADHAISQFIQGLRNPWTDPVMIFVTSLGDVSVTVPIAIVTLGWLAVMRAWRLAGGVAIALLATQLLVGGLKAVVRIPRPVTIYSGGDSFAFPSGHVTMTTVLFGLLTWLAASGGGPRSRVTLYTITAGWIITVAISRIYLGAHWPSDVLAGVSLGAIVVTVVAVLYRNTRRKHLPGSALVLVSAAAFTLVGAWHIAQTYEAQVQRYRPQPVRQSVSALEWKSEFWRQLPRYRVDLAGEQEEPLILQWVGTIGELQARLVNARWRRPPDWTMANAVGFLKPDMPITALPAPPALHDGKEPDLVLTRDADNTATRWVIYAWDSEIRIIAQDGGSAPLLLSAVIRQGVTHPGNLLSIPQTIESTPVPEALLASLGGSIQREDHRTVRLAQEGNTSVGAQ